MREQDASLVGRARGQWGRLRTERTPSAQLAFLWDTCGEGVAEACMRSAAASSRTVGVKLSPSPCKTAVVQCVLGKLPPPHDNCFNCCSTCGVLKQAEQDIPPWLPAIGRRGGSTCEAGEGEVHEMRDEDGESVPYC